MMLKDFSLFYYSLPLGPPDCFIHPFFWPLFLEYTSRRDRRKNVVFSQGPCPVVEASHVPGELVAVALAGGSSVFSFILHQPPAPVWAVATL